MLAPIILFTYKRLDCTKQTIEALQKNELADQSILYIFSDGPKEEEDVDKVRDVRQYLYSISGFKDIKISCQNENFGLANSIINGVTKVVNQHGKAIVMEDDLLTAKGFLRYHNDCLSKYVDHKNVFQISGFNFLVKKIRKKNTSFFYPMVTSLGWSTWADRWQIFDVKSEGYTELKTNDKLAHRFDLDGSFPYSNMLIRQMETSEIDSWAIQWWWSVFRKNGISLFPDKTLVEHIGFVKDASHAKKDNHLYRNKWDKNYHITNFPEQIVVNDDEYKKLKSFLYKHKINKEQNFLSQIIKKVFR